MFQRLRRSFRRKKASYCINCGHVSKECYHQEYENLCYSSGGQGGTQTADDLKWLDLDYMQLKYQQHHLGHQIQVDVREREHGQEDNMTINNKELLINNNSLNNYISLRRGGEHVPKHIKNTNHYRNSAHIPVYNNYIPFPAPMISKPTPSYKVWSMLYF